MLTIQLVDKFKSIGMLLVGIFAIGYTKIIVNYYILLHGLNYLISGLITVALLSFMTYMFYQTFITFRKMNTWLVLVFFIPSLIMTGEFSLKSIFIQGQSPFELPLYLSAGFSMIGNMFFSVLFVILLMTLPKTVFKLFRFFLRRCNRFLLNVYYKFKPTLQKVKQGIEKDWD